ncbi:bifunctional DNA-binding transcriptional regulator/O6-methylguanine-DNA methyltransferase Ada [Roseospira marina]|uniref:methylated-DNA--[protein]-cysteine S-methyltransferase n=1 Tax=Roseospira marina TaxID=140057 RepID=A0A5M6I7E1_9PROT|nr:bifunctional DNA-binding transcriptional regulator/O6-methylguanine-DNA methyltransferase Ada [Roseospira marina]KAA5604181.1 bifunctional DNA-binding transcriptional regulator/O6-methylguanine-DNA methyltransferase Ada [Roseospira marina]MBB4315725.1 AraC family transcriptional regulator of adaptative response/methylated-DNA-[protein]-cysteine methyltransferase [Roseospira marina]MBB5088837.1 AraC family transcriptional regulator of adaptative response/methylated-DNA-[protein]-cysteine methy
MTAGTGEGRDARRWRAVADRQPIADEPFVYAVATTGIYCRPGCPSRTPNRENVVYFATPAAAEAAGYRPCRRCWPQGADPDDSQTVAVARACRRLETDEAEPALADLAADAGLSAAQFRAVFKDRTGLTPKGYARAVRGHRMRAALEEGATVTEATYAAGYSGSARAHADAPGVLGMTASAYRKGGAGEVIDHATADSALGRVLVAATARGLCGIALGDDDGALLATLWARFPKATLRADGPAAQAVLPVVLRVVADPRQNVAALPEVPLDLRGTAFQLRVWEELRRIPPGETRTYTEVAAAIGQPSATRAVANACGANPVAPVVPCHRVVRSDGGLGGYRWGLERKKALLREEEA